MPETLMSRVGPQETLPSATPMVADVDHILKQMAVLTTLIPAMAATPRIDLDDKYKYSQVLAKITDVTSTPSSAKKRDRPPVPRPPTDLSYELSRWLLCLK